MARFVTSNKHTKEIDSLLALHKRNDETLCQYAARYWELFESCDEVISARGFKLDLNTDDELVYDDLARNKPKSMQELMKCIEGWCQLIESKVEHGIEKTTPLKATVVSLVGASTAHIPTSKK